MIKEVAHEEGKGGSDFVAPSFDRAAIDVKYEVCF